MTLPIKIMDEYVVLMSVRVLREKEKRGKMTKNNFLWVLELVQMTMKLRMTRTSKEEGGKFWLKVTILPRLLLENLVKMGLLLNFFRKQNHTFPENKVI